MLKSKTIFIMNSRRRCDPNRSPQFDQIRLTQKVFETDTKF